ncbi:MAG: DUF547 domain-containing protein [Proteobacteria bacterium]|nr:DUF547 domain-containing protein [Pseudomonadota bacterium]
MKPLFRIINFFVMCLFFLETGFALDHRYPIYDELLGKYVHEKGHLSKLDYAGFKTEQKKLELFIKEIEQVTLVEYNRWTTQQQLAFLINAYNGLTIKLILTKYPDLKSIKDLGGFFSSPWSKEFFTLFGVKQNLDYIEHTLLRKKFSEPRIHFAIVCASIGCPALKNEAYLPATLDQQLEMGTLNFLQDESRNRFDEKNKTLLISKIFDWFKEDFEKKDGSVKQFVSRYITKKQSIRVTIMKEEVDVGYLEYNWNLNGIR